MKRSLPYCFRGTTRVARAERNGRNGENGAPGTHRLNESTTRSGIDPSQAIRSTWPLPLAPRVPGGRGGLLGLHAARPPLRRADTKPHDLLRRELAARRVQHASLCGRAVETAGALHDMYGTVRVGEEGGGPEAALPPLVIADVAAAAAAAAALAFQQEAPHGCGEHGGEGRGRRGRIGNADRAEGGGSSCVC